MPTIIVNETESKESQENSEPTPEQQNQAIEYGQLLERNRNNEAKILELQTRIEAAETQARISTEQSSQLQIRIDQLLTELEAEEMEDDESDEATLVSPEPEPQPEPEPEPETPKRQASKLQRFLFGDDD